MPGAGRYQYYDYAVSTLAVRNIVSTTALVLISLMMAWLMGGCGLASQTGSNAALDVSPVATAMPTSTPLRETQGEYIDVGSRQLFITCMGEGSPTVILEAGMGAGHSTWAGVQPSLARITHVCSYDRAGMENSDPASTPRTIQDVVKDLHTLLSQAEVPGPYILVGHSFGGLHVRLYANQYPDEVVGIMLIDAVHEEWWTRAAALLPPASADESERLRGFRAFLEDQAGDPTTNAEGIDIPASAAQIRAAGSLGDLPLVVLTAGQPDVLAPGLPSDLEARLIQLMQTDLQAELAALSSRNIHILAQESGHVIHKDQPELVVRSIGLLLDMINGT